MLPLSVYHGSEQIQRLTTAQRKLQSRLKFIFVLNGCDVAIRDLLPVLAEFQTDQQEARVLATKAKSGKREIVKKEG